MEGTYTIRDLERLSGIHAHTIRMWEKRYGILSPERTHSNLRTYNDQELRFFLKLSMLNKQGIKISRLSAMNDEDLNHLLQDFMPVTDSGQQHADALLLAMLSYDEEATARILQRIILQSGLEDAMTSVVFPFLDRIGLLWQTGAVNPAQEHFFSHLIRQKIMAATDGISIRPQAPPEETFLVFSLPGDLHEIGLLFSHFLIRRYGYRSIYLGASIPFEDLEKITETIPVKWIVVQSLSSNEPGQDIRLLEKLRSMFRNSTIITGGQLAAAATQLNRDNIMVMKDFSSFRAWLSSDFSRQVLS